MITVYIYYLILPDDFTNTLDRWEKECFLYISSIFKKLTSNKYDGYMMYLYAWTTKKKLASKFESLHNMELFKGYEVEMTKSEYKEFKIRHEYARFKKQLVENYYPDDNGFMYITKAEAYDLHELSETFATDQLFDLSVWPGNMFKEEYHAALDRLRYTYYYGIQTVDDPTMIYDNDSYGISTDGYGDSIELYADSYICYLDLFRPLLRKGLIRREDLEVLPKEYE